MRGFFITMEGPDGSGKSTQIKKLKEFLESNGHEVILTREPGGTRISEEIRNIILNKENTEMDYVTEALLYASARAQLVAEVINPALNKGQTVICDRFVDSSIVYQGIARGLGIDLVERINQAAIRECVPNLTLLLKISPDVGINRKALQGDKDRLELEALAFHEKVFTGYLMLEERYPDRVIGLDASNPIDELHKEIVGIVSKFI